MGYILGIDIGVVYTGWGLIKISGDKIEAVTREKKLCAGVRIFPEADAKNNLTRRQFRGIRRVIRRKKNRLSDLKKLLEQSNLWAENDENINPYFARQKCIYEEASPKEISTALYHLVKRRGTTLDIAEEEKKEGKNELSTKERLEINKNELQDKYICQLQIERLQESIENLKSDVTIRGIANKFKTEDYVKEGKAILEKQAEFYNQIDENFTKKFLAILQRKRKYYDGPGSKKSPTPYGRYYIKNGQIFNESLINRMRGKCTYDSNEYRASAMCYSAGIFNLLNDLNNITFADKHLSYEDKKELIEKYCHNGKNITPTILNEYIIKKYNVKKEEIGGYRVDLKKDKKPILTTLDGYNTFIKIAKENNLPSDLWKKFDLVDEIIDILTAYKDYENRNKKIFSVCKRYYSDDVCDEIRKAFIEDTSYKKYHSLSLKTMNIIMDDLWHTSHNQMYLFNEKGIKPNKNTQKKGNKIKFDDTAILSPIAKRAHREAIKIINKVRELYGELDAIVIEMAREKNSEEEKDNYKALQEERGKEEEKICKLLNIDDLNQININAKQRLALRLWLEQDGKSLYSNKPIALSDIINHCGKFEIDHIIPLSLSFDDSQSNKVLCFCEENQNKGQRTPWEYYSSGKANISFDVFKANVLNLNESKKINNKKKEMLLEQRDIAHNSELRKNFINRNLVDTRYACRSLMLALKEYFRVNEIDTRVYSIRGSFTSAFRKKARLKKERDKDFSHHAIDALIVAALSKSRSIADINNYLFDYEGKTVDLSTGEILNEDDFFDKPILNFIKDLRGTQAEDFYYSHKVDRKVNRAISDQTIYSTRNVDDKDKVVRKISNIYGLDKKNCQKLIKKLLSEKDKENFFIYKYNKDVYDKLIEIIKAYPDSDNPFSKYKADFGYVLKDGKVPVKNLKYYAESINTYLELKQTAQSKDKKVVMLNLNYLRIDIYKNEKGTYKFIALPNNIVKEKNNKEYLINKNEYDKLLENNKIDNNFEFCFSLYKNDMFSYVKDNVRYNVLYNSYSEKGRFGIKNIFNNETDRVSIGKLSNMYKINTDVLGNRYLIKQEKGPILSLQINK